MKQLRFVKVILFTFTILILSSLLSGQATDIIKKTDIYANPENSKSVIGRLYPGTEIKKIGKDPSGKFIKATLDFYLPMEMLKEWRVAKGPGEWQVADETSIQLLKAEKEENIVTISVAIKNQDNKTMDMSALLLFKLMDREGNPGNLEFMQSKNSVGIIKPGKILRSELVYRFTKPPIDLELSFQSKLGGDQVFFILGF